VRYFVIAADGNKYGPADIPTLNSWIAEGRLVATQILEDEETGARVEAARVMGLNFMTGAGAVPPPNFAPGQNYQQYYGRPGVGGVGGVGGMYDDGSKDIQNAWIFAVLSIFCCAPITGTIALSNVKKAEAKGNPNATGPKVVAIIGIVLWVLYIGFVVIGAIAGVSKQ